MTQAEIIETLKHIVITQHRQYEYQHIVDFSLSARGFIVLLTNSGPVSIKLDLNERDELWAKWHEAGRESGLTVNGRGG